MIMTQLIKLIIWRQLIISAKEKDDVINSIINQIKFKNKKDYKKFCKLLKNLMILLPFHPMIWNLLNYFLIILF